MEPQQLRLRVLDTVRLSPPPAPAQHAAVVALPLSGLDADRNALEVTFRTLRFFPPPPPSVDPHAVLPPAFEAALGLFPALAGRLLRDGQVMVGAGAVPVVLAEAGLAAADVDTDCPGSALLDRLAPPDGVARSGPYGTADGWREQQRQLTRECFHVSDARVEALRARIADEAGVKLTTFEVVAAFIWRARVKASGTSSGEVVKMVYSMNISKLVDPPLPDGYWGNVCVPVYVAVAAGDLVAQPLAAMAAMIRRSKQAVDDEYVRSYVDFQELHRHDGITAGTVGAFTDWRRLGHGEVDFGWGGPVSVLPLSWRILGSTEPCFLLPYGAGDERQAGFREEMKELLLQPQQSSAGKL